MSLKNFLNSFSVGQLDINGAGIQLPDYISFSFDPTTGRLCLVDNRQNPASPAYEIACWDSNAVTPVTYAELLALAVGNNLESGAFYLITDFRTRHIIPNTAIVNTGAIEPLIVQAASVSAIHPNAISTIFAPDEILYELVDSTTAGGDRGRIYYRRDTVMNNSTWYDWRVVLFRRWDDGAGNLVVLIDNGNAFADFFTFNNSATANSCLENSLAAITDFGIGSLGAPADKLNNFVFNLPCYDNKFETDCFNNTILGDFCAANKVSVQFSNNIKNGKLFVLNTINGVFTDNIIGDDFNLNTVGFQFQSNQIGDVFQSNQVGDSFSNNTIGDFFNENEIGDSFSANTIGNFFEKNDIENDFFANTIGNSFADNKIGNNFNSNPSIGDNFGFNTIGNNFTANITIGNNFNRNIVGDDASVNNIGDDCSNNRFGNFFHDNTIGTLCLGNTAGNDFNNNSIGVGFQNNQIGNGFGNNVIEDAFLHNEIANNFDSNTNIGDNFRFNHIETGLSAVNFAAATHVYNDYSCTIFRKDISGGGTLYRLSYISGADGAEVVNYVAPNA